MASCTRRARLLTSLALLGAAVAVAGCATAPASGPPRQAPGGSSEVQSYVQELSAPGPTSKWTAKEVVLGFLHASASYAFDPAAAKQFLVPQLRTHWHPGQEPVAVVAGTGGPSSLTQVTYPSQIHGQPGPVVQQWQFTGPHLATLSQTGQYQYAPGTLHYAFDLERTGKSGVWLIDKLPGSLLLTESDFDDVYAPRNLFFFAPPAASQPPNVLVADPVFAPLLSSNSALNTDLATRLVDGLLKGQGGWLSGTTISAFPRGTRLLKKVTIVGKTAQVDLGGAAAHAQPITLGEMEGQLVATLSDGEYSPPLASQLQLYINNRPWSVLGPIGLPAPVPTGLPLLLVTDTGGADSVSQLPATPRPSVKPQSKLSPAQLGQGATVTAVATSPDGDHPPIAVGVSTGTGCTIQVYPDSQSDVKQGTYPLSGSTGECTSLSYDANGNLWAVAGGGVWFLQPNKAAVPVTLSSLVTALQHGGKIMALRMAPDAVRAALLVHTSAGNEVLLAAVRLHAGKAALGQPVTVSTQNMTDLVAISWYDPYHLAVLANGQLYDVPLLTGGAGQQPGAAPPAFFEGPTGTDVTLTTEGTELVVGTNQGVVWARSASASGWSQITDGTYPIYPG